MTKFILVSFGLISRLVFEFGIPVIAWIAWGWHIGLAFALWYILWGWTGFSLVRILRGEQDALFKAKLDDHMDGMNKFLEELEKIAEEAKDKKDENESHKNLD